VTPDMICIAKSIGGGFPLAAFGTSKRVMSLISDHKVFTGTYNTTDFDGSRHATFPRSITSCNYKPHQKLSNS